LLIERLSGFSGKTTAWLVVPLIAATVYDVAARYLFNAPTQWAYEVGYMMMGAHALLGMAFTLREGGHIRIWDYWRKSFNTHELSGQSAWNPVIWPFKLVFFIAFLLLVLQILAEVFKAVQYLFGKRASYEGAAGDGNV
jgi:TRAP-type mannitol/chloroaromatic compound transport system permease small subunit